MKTKLRVYVLAIVCLAGISEAQTVLLSPTQDAMIEYDPGNLAGPWLSYGNVDYAAAYTTGGWTRNSTGITRMLIDFNLSGLPANVSIISARLNLHAYGPLATTYAVFPGHSGNDNSCIIDRLNSPWTEMGVFWFNQPSTGGSPNAVSIPHTTNPMQNYLNIDVTNLVQEMVNPSNGNFGFLIKLINEIPTNSKIFCTREHRIVELRPTLEITYNSCSRTIFLNPDYDAPVGFHEGNENEGFNLNFGTADYAGAYSIPSLYWPGIENRNRTLFHFDLSSIPATASITDSRLDLFAYFTMPGNGHMSQTPTPGIPSNNAILQPLTAAWAENTVTWNNQPATLVTNNIPIAGTHNPNQNFLNLNVTNLIQGNFQGPNFGFLLRLQSEVLTNALIFCSREHQDVNRRPRLKVVYRISPCAVDGGEDDPFGDRRLSATGMKNYSHNVSNFLSVFPNPNSGEFTINFSTAEGHYKILVSDVEGRVVKSYQIKEGAEALKVESTELAPGLYFCTLKDGEIIRAGCKIVVQ